MGTVKNNLVYVGDNMTKLAPRHAQGMKINLRSVQNPNNYSVEWFVDVTGIDNYLDVVIGPNKSHIAVQPIKITPGTKSVKRQDKKKGTYNAKERKPANIQTVIQRREDGMQNGELSDGEIRNINITSMMNNLIFNDDYFKRYELFENLFEREGYWYRKYKLCIQINNVYYAATDIIYVRTHADRHLTEEEGYYEISSPYQIEVWEY